jgi:hypothetical protein
MKKQNDGYNDRLEKILTAIFGGIGTIAIIVNLFLKGFSLENFLDGLKDIASLIVVIAVFLIASKVFSFNKKKNFNFNEKFEELLLEWAALNKYLIDTSEISKSKDGKVRAIDMICDHSEILKCNDASFSSSKKGSFLYLPKSEDIESKENSKISFKINKSMFKGNSNMFDTYEEKKSDIVEKIALSIKTKFSDLELVVFGNGDRIEVDFSKLEKEPGNAKRLIDIVEFVKTIFLAIA